MPDHELSAALDVWRIRLDRTESEQRELSALLVPDERERAERYVFPRDRERFVVARACLRRVLASYLDRPAEHLRFCYGVRGKPALDDASIAFNLSHSQALAIVVVGQRDRALGVDIEWQHTVDVEGLATNNFTPSEQRELFALPPALQLEGFFRCWTRKEAYIKAHGEGFSMPLDRFTVSLGEGPGVSLHTDDHAEARWWIRALPIDPGYVAALAADGLPADVRWFDA